MPKLKSTKAENVAEAPAPAPVAEVAPAEVVEAPAETITEVLAPEAVEPVAEEAAPTVEAAPVVEEEPASAPEVLPEAPPAPVEAPPSFAKVPFFIRLKRGRTLSVAGVGKFEAGNWYRVNGSLCHGLNEDDFEAREECPAPEFVDRLAP